VLKEPTASVFRVEVKMVALRSSETLVNTFSSVWRINSEDQHLNPQCLENLKFRIDLHFFTFPIIWHCVQLSAQVARP